MNHFIVSAYAVFIPSLFWGTCHILKKSDIDKIFGMYLLSIALWSFVVGFQSNLLKWLPANVWGWFLHLGCIYIPIFFFHFSILYSRSRLKPVIIFLTYIIGTVFLGLNTFTSFFTNGTAYRDSYAYPSPSVSYPFYFIYFILLIVWGTVLLFKSRKEILPKHQIFFNLVLISHCLAYLGALDNFLIMADIRIFPLYPFGLYLAVPYVTIVGIIFTFKKKIHFNREVDSA